MTLASHQGDNQRVLFTLLNMGNADHCGDLVLALLQHDCMILGFPKQLKMPVLDKERPKF